MDYFDHFLAYRTNLRRSSIGSLFDLVRPPFGEGNGEEANEVVVGGLHNDIGLNQGLPFADKRAKFVGSEIEPMEICETIFALNLIHPQFDLPKSVIFVFLQVGK